ncbi:MAG: TauD/TfdA family dioxygenase [Gammaproteobacteria bacterium]
MAVSSASARGKGGDSPFLLANEDAYRRWRDAKLADYPHTVDRLLVEVADPLALTASERDELVRRARKANTVLYQTSARSGTADKVLARRLGEQLGLVRMDDNLCADDDSVSALRAMPSGSRHEGYIPYTDRPLSWHTDGYYNAPPQRIRAMLLHCVADAAEGGENALLDHEIAYLRLRDAEPGYVRALMQPDAMTIPANVEGDVEIRPARTGPVFAVDPLSGCLHMRYTARKRNILWKRDAPTLAAVAFLERLLAEESEYTLRCRLRPGQGIISNNALHKRSGFRDDPQAGRSRLILRARYYDRIRGTACAP